MKTLTGRLEKRSRLAVPIRWWTIDAPSISARATTENVSPHGARIVTDHTLRPSTHLFVARSGTLSRLEATVVYCRPLGAEVFRVGLHFRENIWKHWSRRIEPYSSD